MQLELVTRFQSRSAKSIAKKDNKKLYLVQEESEIRTAELDWVITEMPWCAFATMTERGGVYPYNERTSEKKLGRSRAPRWHLWYTLQCSFIHCVYTRKPKESNDRMVHRVPNGERSELWLRVTSPYGWRRVRILLFGEPPIARTFTDTHVCEITCTLCRLYMYACVICVECACGMSCLASRDNIRM